VKLIKVFTEAVLAFNMQFWKYSLQLTGKPFERTQKYGLETAFTLYLCMLSDYKVDVSVFKG
jgi:hypothetical protein